jgi:DNA polymerase I-like protein with 3'-5' exonuclease and polymerase domains
MSDFHKDTAQNMFQTPDPTKEQKRVAKLVGFAFLYTNEKPTQPKPEKDSK